MGVILAFIGAYLYLRYTPKVYKSSAKIKILNKTKGLELPSEAFIFNRSNINLENEIEVIKSYRIMEQVVDRLGLDKRFYEEGNVLTTEIDRLPFQLLLNDNQNEKLNAKSYLISINTDAFEVVAGNQADVLVFPNFDTKLTSHNLPFELSMLDRSKVSKLQGKTFKVILGSAKVMTSGLKNSIGINMLGASDLLELTYASQSIAKNERILNTLIEVFNEDGINDRQDISRRTIDFIDKRFLLLAEELDSIETGISDFKRKSNLVTVESDAALGLSQRTLSENELFSVESQIILSDLLDEDITNPNNDSDLLPSNIGLTNTSVNELVNTYNTLVFERDNLIASAGENNPAVIILNQKLKDLKANIYMSITSYKLQLQASKKQLMGKNSKYASKVYSLPAKEKIILEIKRQQEIKQTLYLFLLQKREEAAINLAITEPSIKVVEDAISSGIPISPNSKNIYIMAVLAGLLIPFGIIYAINLLDTKVRGREDIVEINSQIPVVGELPKVKQEDLVFSDPDDNSIQSEAFRILSSNVDYILPVKEGKKGKVIYCTSTIKGEGKTYVSLNLSLALSSINRKVLLIGADLRNPQIHTHIAEDKHKPGLSNYLHDVNYNWKDSIIKGFDKHPNHDIILSGSIPPNPAHLLTNGRFEKLIEEAKLEYDYVIVDTAPTILVTDTMLISQLADATIYLVRANYTEKNLLNFSKGLFESGKLKNVAYVLNSVDTQKSYGYGYNYGYNYGYGSKA
ncbi:GumC family protein [Winogradskyella ludwigii]|uniref:GumC family protein n=1 Tax=Winogradskyella ludwigii TaxID=2686076 RepID=UPI0015C7E1F4|nr:polysaccharide biosynthesis tyrosine autokinase [Winogradskyella ludwigii]